MLTVSHVSKRFGDTQVLDNITCSINTGDRIGLIGPNGAGKTTLVRIITGDEQPDSGTVTLTPNRRIGFLRQGFADVPDGTLADALDISTDGLLSAQRALDAATVDLADPDRDPDELAAAFEHATAAFEAKGGYAAIDELHAVLDRFGLGEMALDRPLATLSGGQKTRAGLAGLLASRPDLLLLDEPTNHLDVDALSWLGEFLRTYPGGLLMVSHDRGFLDDIATEIFELSDETHQLTAYAGNYSDYAEAKTQAEESLAAAYRRQQDEIARIEQDIRTTETHARSIEASTIDYAIRKKAAKIARPAVVRKRKLERMLESEEHLEKPTRRWGMALDLGGTTGGGRDVAILDHVDVAFGDRPVLQDVSLHVRSGDRVAIIGPNGGGKSTLLNVIAGRIDPDSGVARLGANIRVGYFAQEQDMLNLKRTVLREALAAATMSESDTRTFLHRFLFGGDTVHRRVGDLSYGERARLMLAMLVLKGANLLLLDEPLNHLDIAARERFEQALAQFEGTLLLVVHDRYAVERLATRVIELRDGSAVELDPALVAAS